MLDRGQPRSSATSAALAHLIRAHLDPEWVRVIEGAVPETTAILEQRFDLIFYTGNSTVGRIVARAAAEHLTPTVLELGGKSPVFVDEGVDPAAAARRIMWGKLTNTGQTCVAPDYLMATPRTIEKLVPHLKRAAHAMHGSDASRSPEFGRMVNRVMGDPASQLHERHNASDFDTRTQDKIAPAEQ